MPEQYIAWAVIVLGIAFGGAVFLGDPHEPWGYLKAVGGILTLLAFLAGLVVAGAAFVWAVTVVTA